MSFFECTIRILGGLVAAHDLTGDSVFVEQARVVADHLMPAFSTPTGIPRATINFREYDIVFARMIERGRERAQ